MAAPCKPSHAPQVPDPVIQLSCLDASLAMRPVFAKYQVGRHCTLQRSVCGAALPGAVPGLLGWCRARSRGRWGDTVLSDRGSDSLLARAAGKPSPPACAFPTVPPPTPHQAVDLASMQPPAAPRRAPTYNPKCFA